MARLQRWAWPLVIALATAPGIVATPSVKVDVKAAFPAPPYLLELLETAASENATAYFPLLDRIATGHFAAALTDAELYKSFVKILQDDGHVVSPEAVSTFNLALSLRSAAPRIEAHYQYYNTAVEPVLGKTQTLDCENWILLDNKQYCSAAFDKPLESDVFSSGVQHLPFDRIVGSGKEAVLYADPTSAAFGAFHTALRDAAEKGTLQYRLRYRILNDQVRQPLPVNGYGVELALKKTDYIVIDDREASQESSQKPLGSAGVDLNTDEDQIADLKPLSTSEVKSLGMKAASFILQNENPFDALVKLTQDFPKFSASIAAHEASKEFTAEHEKHREANIPPGVNFLWMNGLQLIERQIEPFALVDMIRSERKFLDGVRELGFTGKQSISILGHKDIVTAKAGDDVARYDWTDQQEGGNVLLWLNDLEDGESYPEFAGTIMQVLQPAMPGQLPRIAKNLFNLVVPVDFSNTEDLEVVARLLNLVTRKLPLRVGLVPLTSTEDGAIQAKVIYHIMKTYGVASVVDYLLQYHEREAGSTTEHLLANVTESAAPASEDAAALSYNEILESDSYAHQVKLAKKWASRLGADTTVRPAFANGVAVARDASWMQAMSMKLGEDLQFLQHSVYTGKITDEDSVVDMYLEQALKGRNVYLTTDDDEPLRVLDVHRLYEDHAGLFGGIPVLESYAESTKENWAALALVADLTSKEGQELLLSALAFKRNSPGVQLDIVHSPSTGEDASKLNSALLANKAQLADVETLDELKKLLDLSAATEDKNHNAALANFLGAANIVPGSQMLMLNGRLIGPFAADNPFTEDNMQQFLDMEQTQRILPVYAAMDDLGMGEKLSGPLAAAKLTSIVALSSISDLPEGIFESAPSIRSTLYDTLDSAHTAIETGNPDTASVHIAGLLDPVSEKGQRWAPILKALSELDGVYVKLFMNPKTVINELPVKRFYRYVLDSKPSFDEAGTMKGLSATFKGLPSEALLTAGTDVPPAWLVSSKESVYDLDNIKLSSVKTDIEATYELEHILIEGHSREGNRSSPPRGAQLVLSTEKDPLLTDTIVMANLGFFQFKANPGIYSIHLKEGRSAEIYDIESVGAQGYNAVPGDEGTDVALMTFQGTTLYPRLKRKPGMQKADVLEMDDGSEDTIVANARKFAAGLFGSSKSNTDVAGKKPQADINIFSVASGHLYERMLNIMMVSVMRHTKHTVKFWFIEQFLSPSFKEFIPYMAEEYGFQYEMVTYKWPHWLRQQKEKQREIWGYKILFLDVLFPLDLDKVIFVDADQIVRTDMIDLVRHDLQGAPYGFTPMCDSRVEMEGFRFWKQGYWENFLRGRPYHISALYVVDLRRFRQLAAGDRLRQQYHSLSADPNSLSNLDQDLPNNMQFQIPIHSLPQEWLWCETWCSDESLTEARTIDLCNNPETKEPKLDRARRQVPEWTVYDEEIAALDRRRRQTAGEGSSKAEEGVNTKSRRFEGESAHTIDEL